MDTNRHYIVHFEYCSAGFANPFLLSIHWFHYHLPTWSSSKFGYGVIFPWSRRSERLGSSVWRWGMSSVCVCVCVSADLKARCWIVPYKMNSPRFSIAVKLTTETKPWQSRGSAIIIMFVPQSSCLSMFVHCLSNLFRSSSMMILFGLTYLSFSSVNSCISHS